MTIKGMDHKRLFVGNLFPEVTSEELEKKFSRCEVKGKHVTCNEGCFILVLGRFQRLKSRLRRTLMETWPKHLPSLTLIVEKTELVNAFLPLPTKSEFITLYNIFRKCNNVMH